MESVAFCQLISLISHVEWTCRSRSVFTQIHRCTRMYAYAHECISIHIYIYILACVHAYVHTYIHVCMHTYIHNYIHTCIFARTHIYTQTYLSAKMQFYAFCQSTSLLINYDPLLVDLKYWLFQWVAYCEDKMIFCFTHLLERIAKSWLNLKRRYFLVLGITFEHNPDE